jgi:hypothetical protein
MKSAVSARMRAKRSSDVAAATALKDVDTIGLWMDGCPVAPSCAPLRGTVATLASATPEGRVCRETTL